MQAGLANSVAEYLFIEAYPIERQSQAIARENCESGKRYCRNYKQGKCTSNGRGADDQNPRTVLYFVEFPIVGIGTDNPQVECFRILQDHIFRIFVNLFLHLFVIKADTAMGHRISGQVTTMDPVGRPAISLLST